MSSISDHPQIPPELAAEMTPAVRAFVEVLLARIAKLEAEVAELKRKKTPQNSSLPPSSAWGQNIGTKEKVLES